MSTKIPPSVARVITLDVGRANRVIPAATLTRPRIVETTV